MKHAYVFTLSRHAVVATLDLSAKNLHLLQSDHWLSDRRNIIQLHLKESAFENHGPGRSDSSDSSDSSVRGSSESKQTMMMRWTTADVSAFLEARDLCGPAAQLFANGLDGADLVNSTGSALVSDLRLTTFAARKILAARDTFTQ